MSIIYSASVDAVATDVSNAKMIFNFTDKEINRMGIYNPEIDIPGAKFNFYMVFSYEKSGYLGETPKAVVDYSFRNLDTGETKSASISDTIYTDRAKSAWFSAAEDYSNSPVFDFFYDGRSRYSYDITVTLSGDTTIKNTEGGNTFHLSGEFELYLPKYDGSYKLLTAPNFSDEENPTITFNNTPTYNWSAYGTTTLNAYIKAKNNIVVSRNNINTSSSNFTFTLTESERQALRNKVTSGITENVEFVLRTSILTDKSGMDSNTYWHDEKLTKTLTLANAYPVATLTVEDVDPTTLALTGNKNIIVKYYSDASYVINSTASKGATIVSEQVTCGNKTSTAETGVLENVESNIFTFGAVDSRNNGVAGTLTKGFVDYIKLTCQQQIKIDLSGAASTGAAATVKIEGNYFNGSFGAVNNTLTIQLRYGQEGGTMGNWITVSNVSISDNTYSAEYEVAGLNYSKTYIIQSRAVDKLTTAETAQFTTKVMPVFDWSGEDFNFNVPVNINADTLNIDGNTVIRHTGTNTVLSGNNGNIYIRPGGTEDTDYETIFYGNGNIKFGGTVSFDYSLVVGGNILNDFVIEYGEEAMGSNGTWYWRKWASGKAECWGCRNFGNMGISTAFGSLYRSAIFNQDLPSDLFQTTPDVINIQMLNGGDGCWIAKWNDVAPSAVVSGSFIVINPVRGNISPSNIGFYVAGLSK